MTDQKQFSRFPVPDKDFRAVPLVHRYRGSKPVTGQLDLLDPGDLLPSVVAPSGWLVGAVGIVKIRRTVEHIDQVHFYGPSSGM